MYYIFITIICIYLLSVFLLSVEGRRRESGFYNTLLLSFFLTPIIGLIVVIFSPRKATISHYVKIDKSYNGDNNKAKIVLKNTKKNDPWIKIKASDFGFA